MADSSKKSSPSREQQAREAARYQKQVLKSHLSEYASVMKARQQNAAASQAIQQANETANQQRQALEADAKLEAQHREQIDKARKADLQSSGGMPAAPQAGPVDTENPIGALGRPQGAGGIHDIVNGGAGAQRALAGLQGGGEQAPEVPQGGELGGGMGGGGGGQPAPSYRQSGGTLSSTETTQEFRQPNFVDILFGGGGAPIQTGQTVRTLTRPDVLSEYQRAQVAVDEENNRASNRIAVANADRLKKAADEKSRQARVKSIGDAMASRVLAKDPSVGQELQGIAAQDPQLGADLQDHIQAYLGRYSQKIESAIASRAPATPRASSALEQDTQARRELQTAIDSGDESAIKAAKDSVEFTTKRGVTLDLEHGTFTLGKPFNRRDSDPSVSAKALALNAQVVSHDRVSGMLNYLVDAIDNDRVPVGIPRKVSELYQGALSFVQGMEVVGDTLHFQNGGAVPVSFVNDFYEGSKANYLEDKARAHSVGMPFSNPILEGALAGTTSVSEKLLVSIAYERARAFGRVTDQDYDKFYSELSLSGLKSTVLANLRRVVEQERTSAVNDSAIYRGAYAKDPVRGSLSADPFQARGVEAPSRPTPGPVPAFDDAADVQRWFNEQREALQK